MFNNTETRSISYNSRAKSWLDDVFDIWNSPFYCYVSFNMILSFLLSKHLNILLWYICYLKNVLACFHLYLCLNFLAKINIYVKCYKYCSYFSISWYFSGSFQLRSCLSALQYSMILFGIHIERFLFWCFLGCWSLYTLGTSQIETTKVTPDNLL